MSDYSTLLYSKPNHFISYHYTSTQRIQPEEGKRHRKTYQFIIVPNQQWSTINSQLETLVCLDQTPIDILRSTHSNRFNEFMVHRVSDSASSGSHSY